MFASNTVLGFQRRENLEEEQVEDAEAECEILDLGQATDSLLGRSVPRNKSQNKLAVGERAASGSLGQLTNNNRNKLWVRHKETSGIPNRRSVAASNLSSFTVVNPVERRKELRVDDGESGFLERVSDHAVLWFDRRKDQGTRRNEEEEPEFFYEQPNVPVVCATLEPESRKKEDHCNNKEIRAYALPEELVEKIVSMIAFPDILNARGLNKYWHSKFSTSPAASVFQKQVASVSPYVETLLPIILNVEEQWLMGFDHELNRWQKMGMGFEREDLRNWFSTKRVRGAGCLMCGVYNQSQIFVTNILTRTWKWLPSQPILEQPKEIHLLLTGPDSYRVLLVTKQTRQSPEIWCQIYDSWTKSWSIKQSMVNTSLFNSSSAFLDGSLYVMEYDPDDHNDVMKLLAYNVESGTWTNIPHPFGSLLHEIETYELLVCQSHVMAVIQLHPVATWFLTSCPTRNTPRNTIMVYKLDPVSLDIREVARGPPEQISDASSTLFASDNNCIYFGNPQVASSSVLVLDVRTRVWSCLPPPSTDGSFKNKWAKFPFQPGLNPFVSV